MDACPRVSLHAYRFKGVPVGLQQSGAAKSYKKDVWVSLCAISLQIRAFANWKPTPLRCSEIRRPQRLGWTPRCRDPARRQVV
jgi:hypothetical protein